MNSNEKYQEIIDEYGSWENYLNRKTMTPQEKAEELVEMMTIDMSMDFYYSNECAIVLAITMLAVYENKTSAEDLLKEEYWKEVIIELEKYKIQQYVR